MKKITIVALLLAIAPFAHGVAKPRKSALKDQKYVSTGHAMQGNKVCITLDKTRNAGVCMTANEIQSCMDKYDGACYAQLVRPGGPDDGNAAPLIQVCDPITAPARRPNPNVCDEKEWKQYRFRFGSGGAYQAVLY